MNPLLEAKRLRQSIWLGNLSRTLLQEGGLKQLIEQDGISGVTSNPSILHKAVPESPYYRGNLARLKTSGFEPERRHESLVIADIQAACDLLRPVYASSQGDDGYVSLEVSPRLADDEKVLVTPAGIRAFERPIVSGILVPRKPLGFAA